MLGTLDPTQNKKWSQYIGHLVHSYNCTRNEATGYSPYFLMFGREARLPVDICFGVSSDSSSERTYLKYVSDMKKQLQAAYKVAESTAGKQNHENKQRYDKKIRYTQLMPGDRVLIRNLGLHGKHKLADRWVSTPYVVESQMSNVPVFRLKPESGDGPNKILHRNHLLPLGQKVRLEPVVNIELTPSRRTLQRRRKRKGNEKLPGKCTPQNDEKVEEVKNPKDEKDFDSEDEDIGVWYDVPNTNCMSREVEEMSEPFSLDLDIVWNQMTGESERTEQVGEAIESSQEAKVATGVEADDNETSNSMEEIQEEEPEVQGEVETSEEIEGPGMRRSQKIKKAPVLLTYDKPGVPSLAPVVRYCSTLYKWIG